MKLRFFVGLMFPLFLVACSASVGPSVESPGVGIIGGQDTGEDLLAASYVVMIYLEDENGTSSICTGTFISKNAILTAGHCIASDVSQMSLYFGRKPYVEKADVLTATGVERVQGYKKSAQERNDLAVIYFSGGLPAGAKIAELPGDIDPLGSFENLLLLGYGVNEEDTEEGEKSIGILRSARVALHESQLEASSFRLNQEQGRGACYGDSGGPAFVLSSTSMVVVGVASAVQDHCNIESLYMRSSAYLDWLRKVRDTNK